MNTLDAALILVLVGCAAGGVAVGLVRFFFGFLSMALGAYLAKVFGLALAKELCSLFPKLTPSYSQLAATFIIFFIVTILVFQLGLLLIHTMKALQVRWLDRLLGGLAVLLIGWGLCGLLLKFIAATANPQLRGLLAGSLLKPYILLPMKFLHL